MKRIIIFLGQSNIVSVHGMEGDIPAEYGNLPRNDIGFNYWTMNNAAGGVIRESVLGDIVDFDLIRDGVNDPWFAAELSCAQRLVDVYGLSDLVVIKVAQGSTSLAVDWADGSVLMNRLYERVREVIQGITDNEEWKIIAVCRMQGESDSNDLTETLNFKVNLENHYSDIRRLFGEGYESLPIIEGKINKEPNGSATLEMINKTRLAQFKVTNGDYRSELVETDDLTRNPDGVHYVTSGLITMGDRMADAIYSLGW